MKLEFDFLDGYGPGLNPLQEVGVMKPESSAPFSLRSVS